MRHYEALWTELKTTGKCRIVAHKAYHARIIKAIWKEKNIDLAFRQECLEAIPPKEYRTATSIEGSVINFTLKLRTTFFNEDSI